jgi:hypothetical protein
MQMLVFYRGRLNDGTTERCASAKASKLAGLVVKRMRAEYVEKLSAGYNAYISERVDEI